MKTSHFEKLVTIIKEMGVIRPRDLDVYGIPREYLRRLYASGILERPVRGIYTLSTAEVTEHHSLIQVCKRVPRGVVCLLTALRFFELTTQSPHEIWIAIDRKSRMPKADGLPLRIVRFSGEALQEGIEHHAVDGVEIKVYTLAKTIADCFKYRNKIGLDVALEALRESRRNHRCTMDDIWHYAKICRVANVMRPYLEALT